MARCILRNDYYCKGLGQTQPKSEAYEKYKQIKEKRRKTDEIEQEEKRIEEMPKELDHEFDGVKLYQLKMF